MKHTLIITLCALMSLLAMQPSSVQAQKPNTELPVIVVPYLSRNITWLPQTIATPVMTNIEVTATCNANWITPRYTDGKLLLDVATNNSSFARSAIVTLKGEGITKDIRIEQAYANHTNEVSEFTSFDIFADPLCTKLRADVTQKDIDTISSYFVRQLAQRIFKGEYDTKYRVGAFKCLPDPAAVGREWGTGKSYDVIQGVTGIMLHPGKVVVFADGVPDEGVTAKFCIYAWTVPEGQTYKSQSFKLKNGINVFNNTLAYDGLAYINYNSGNNTAYDSIRVHILDGIQNGYLVPTMTNDECHAMCQQAPYTTIDLLGERVHGVWETEALTTYTKGKYRKLMNTLDTLLCWIHRLTGLEKYGRIPENKSLAYVNYDYYMAQTGLGVTFMYNQQHRTLNPDRLLKSDMDCIWGYSHEWGHQHQISPYFCWMGMSETTNNMNSVDNCLRMGYTPSNVKNELEKSRSYFLKAGNTVVSKDRTNAYNDRDLFAWNPKMYALCESMKDDKIADPAKNKERGIHMGESAAYPYVYPIFWCLHEYCTKHSSPDYTPDLYEAMRTTNTRDDKYAILAAAQNGVAGKWATYKERYPESCWVTDGYIRTSSNWVDNSAPFIMNFIRQSSILCGINLTPLYETFGFLRTIALRNYNDYGKKAYCMTKEMKDEFIADMDALVADGTLKALEGDIADEVLNWNNITFYDTPNIPN